MRESPPEFCPRCRYELHRLPVRDRCPECAFDFDEHTVVWRPSNPWRSLLVVASFAAPVAVGTWILVRMLLHRTISDVELLGTAGVFVLTALFVLAIIRQNRRGRYLAVNAFGVHARGWRDEVFVAWSDYDYVFRARRGLRLIRRNGKPPIHLSWVFDHTVELADFRATVAAAVERSAHWPTRQ